MAMGVLRETSVLEVICVYARACAYMCVLACINFVWVRQNGMRQEND